MRIQIVAAALPLALAAALVTASAKADGAFITVKDASGQIVGARAPIAAFASGMPVTLTTGHQATGAGGPLSYSPTTFEIDGATDVAAFFRLETAGLPTTVTVEFTTPNAKGEEVVTSVGTFSRSVMSTAAVAFDASGLKGLYSFHFQSVSYATPSPPSVPVAQRVPGVTAATSRQLTGPMPVLKRALMPRIPAAVANAQAIPPPVDAVYLTLTPAQGSSLPATTSSITFDPLTITQAHAATAAFQQSVSNGTFWSKGTISFVHANADGTMTPLVHFALGGVAAKSDQVSLSGGVSTETTSFTYGGLAIYDDLAK